MNFLVSILTQVSRCGRENHPFGGIQAKDARTYATLGQRKTTLRIG